MSDSDDDLDSVEGGLTWEELGHNLFKWSHLAFHTKIQKPDPFTSMDDYAGFCAVHISPKVAVQIINHQNNYRKNMVAYKRERAKETERMVKGNIEKEKQKKDMAEVMGMMNK